MTRPILRPQAEIDLIEGSRYHQAEGGIDLGERFFDAAITALDVIGRMPRGRVAAGGRGVWD